MSQKGRLTCPRCGTRVRIPRLWILGVELIFRCPNCQLPIKTGYRTGAVISGMSLCLSFVAAQLLAYLFSIYTLGLVVLTIIPLWLWLGFRLRKIVLMRGARKQIRKEAAANLYLAELRANAELNSPEKSAPLPRDTVFEELNEVDDSEGA